ncbi:PIG-L family deacetylase [Candidatus Pacearchaeota archaeon]|nr:PIG-L family deacetylase [Candidatus Pacearchaeota archaeon]
MAHPDDETIWMGGTLLSNPKWNVTIISLCRKTDTDRAPKFKKVCRVYNAKSFISDLEDEDLKDLDREEFTKRILKFADKSYDYIFTHGRNGEYGHKRHIETHNAVKFLVDKKQILAKKLFFFSYRKSGAICNASARSDKFINIKDEIYLEKKKIITKIYGFQRGGFEEKCSKKIEGFKIKKIK